MAFELTISAARAPAPRPSPEAPLAPAPINRYFHIPTDKLVRKNHEGKWELSPRCKEKLYHTAAFTVCAAFIALTITAVVFFNLHSPAYLPSVLVGAPLLTPLPFKALDFFKQKAQDQFELYREEQGARAHWENLEELYRAEQANAEPQQAGGAVGSPVNPVPLRPPVLPAAYSKWWNHEAQRLFRELKQLQLSLAAQKALSRSEREDAPAQQAAPVDRSAMEALADNLETQVSHLPEAISRGRKIGELVMAHQMAKLKEAYFYGIAQRPHELRTLEELCEVIPLFPEERYSLKLRGYVGAADVFARLRRRNDFLTVDQVGTFSKEALSDILFLESYRELPGV